jgi:lysophospholipase L1-like esterase
VAKPYLHVVLLALALCSGAARGAVTRYVALGDSITEGKFVGNGGYRQLLQNKLAANALPYLFVGKEDDGQPANNTGFSAGMANPNHEGYGSFRIDQILNGGTAEGHTAPPIASTLTTYQPDVVLLMIGTNDVLQNVNLATAPNRLDALVGTIFTSRPSVRLLLASVTPLSNASREAAAQTYNSAIPDIVAKYRGLGDDVSFVDMHAALNPAADLTDGIHPTAAGYQKIADTWYAAATAPEPSGLALLAITAAHLLRRRTRGRVIPDPRRLTRAIIAHRRWAC